ncbi:MAG TPA: 1-deoxy-D-xylulose-5-phosphate reductoisomerase [Kiloniellales bacterium]|nr:1-deoxy-D-xylulose-5-phosphate reductoisomerase [Kiloniellales bacterium]
MTRRRVTLLGATGSIGQSTLDLVSRNPEQFEIEALTARSSVGELAEAAKRLHAKLAVVADPSHYAALKEALAGSDVEAAAGPEALVEAAQRPSEILVSAIVGAAGLAPTLAAVKRGATVVLANKEALVSAGALMMRAVAKSKARLLPADSEHNAIFQVFEQEQRHAIDRIILTASGGPFRTCSLDEMAGVTPAQAVAHPNWSMGAKISVDSATMMNKGLELIEAHYLFDLPEEKIEILVHPQSVIHSMVGYADGSVLAQLGVPDMRTPLAYCLSWPHRMRVPVARLDLAALGQLTFEPPDEVRFPALRLARSALRAGGAQPAILNAANEVAVEAFLAGHIAFPRIAATSQEVLERLPTTSVDNLEELLAADAEARRLARSVVEAGVS